MQKLDQTTTLQSRLIRLLTHGSSLSKSKRRALYFGIAMAALTLIWLPTILFLSVKSTTYTSRWDLILPGSGAGLAVSLESVGQASATAVSPFTNHSVDPKINYKAIAESVPVLTAAANKMQITVKQFGKPRIKLVDQTALMHFSISAKTAEEAHQKALTLHQSFLNELERLRSDEMQKREDAVSHMLRSYNDNLHNAQQNIINYQATSRIISLAQFKELTMNLERMRVSLRKLKAERANISGNIESLKSALKTDLNIAAAFHTLNQDAVFQELVEKWTQAVSELSTANSKWAHRHPDVVAARHTHDYLFKLLKKRISLLAPGSGIAPGKLIALGKKQTSLYTQLVELSSKENGLKRQIDITEESLKKQQKFLDGSTTDASNLEDLKRKHQVATAVMTTALAKLDMGKSDHFSSYPLLQILAEPTLPEKPDTMGRNLAILGALFATLVSLFGLLLLWIRKSYLQKLLKNA